MSEEPLTKKEWEAFLCNHWIHMKEELANIKSNVSWLKWLNALIIAGLIGYALKDFLNV
jgi:hypothetical protein